MIGPEDFEEKGVVGYSDHKPSMLMDGFFDWHKPIIAEYRVPDDPYYTLEPGKCSDEDEYIEAGPLHSGKYVVLTPHKMGDLIDFSYWTFLELDADKRPIKASGMATQDDYVNDIVAHVHRKFEDLEHYWTPEQVQEIKVAVAFRVDLMARLNDPVL